MSSGRETMRENGAISVLKDLPFGSENTTVENVESKKFRFNDF
jgi:hypothetical protein